MTFAAQMRWLGVLPLQGSRQKHAWLPMLENSLEKAVSRALT